MRRSILPLFAGMLLIATGCVSKKKYVSATTHVSALQADSVAKVGEIEALAGKVSELSAEMGKLGVDLAASSSTIESQRASLAAKNKRLQELERTINAQSAAMNSLRQTVSNALVKFRSDELTVHQKDGKVYVSLSEGLLFKSGSAELDPKGQDAISRLREVLATQPDIHVLVEGHTDSIPIKTARFKDNLALSTARANSVARVLLDGGQLPGTRVTTAGRGDFDPVASNSDPAGRALNRRTEIILAPDLRALYQLVEGR